MLSPSVSVYSEKSADHTDKSKNDYLLDVECSLPFIVDENTPIEYEVNRVIKQFKSMIYSYMLRILIIVLVLVMVLYFQGILMFMSDRYYMTTPRVPLLDRIHQLLEPYDHPFTPTLCNTLMFLFLFTGILKIVLFTPFFYFLELFLRYVALFGTAYFIRGFFVYMTTMPSCYYKCEPDIQMRPFFMFAVRIIAGYMGIVNNCTDLIISGHTMFTMITCILFVQNLKYLISKIIVVLFSMFVLFTIIACKYHYTVDVMFGFLIALLLQYYYYTKIDEHGVNTVNKMYESQTVSGNRTRTTKVLNSLFARFIVKMEMVEEKIVLGQKMITLYKLVNSKEGIIDDGLLKKFNHIVHLFGANESDDLLNLYRGTQMMNFYYWKLLYNKIFRRKQNVVLV